MRAKNILFFSVLSIIYFFNESFSQTPANDLHWGTPIWADTFKTFTKNGSFLRKGVTDYWEILNNFDHGGEPQVYSNSNTTIDTGIGVVLTAKKKDSTCTSCSNGGVFLSNNSGTSWSMANNGLTTSQNLNSFIVSGGNLFAGLNGGGVVLSTNDGASWTAKNSGLVNLYVTCFAVNGSNLFVGTDGGGVFLSTNSGASWSSVNTGLGNSFVNCFAVNGSNLFAGTNGGTFLSTNNGTSWAIVFNQYSVISLAINGINIFAGTTGGGVYLSTNNGTSWTAKNSGLTNLTINSLFLNGSNLFAGTNGGGVFLSTDTAANWTAKNSGLGNLFVKCFALNGSNLFTGTSGGGIFLSSNNGTSWTADNGTSPNNITNLTVNSLVVKGSNLFAGTPGTSYPLHHYTSGAIVSLDSSHKPKYGYIEAKIKLKDTYGLFPALWTCTDSGSYQEIDVFEMVPGTFQGCESSPYYGITHNKNYMTSNLHTSNSEKGCTGLPDDRGQVNTINDYTQWHTYSVEWSPSKMIFYVDDIAFRNSQNPGIDSATGIILNLALSSFVKWDVDSYYNPSAPDYYKYFESTTYSPANLNTDSSKMEVEYINYYKLNGGTNNYDCNNVNLTVDSSNYNTSEMDIVKKSLTTNGTISIPSSGYTHKNWRAADYILINGNFTVPFGSELYLDVNPCY